MLDSTPAATDALFDAVYARLKAMAGRQLARRGQDTLETTALVHELYLRMSTGRELAFAHPAQFFTYAARAMPTERRIPVNKVSLRRSASDNWW